MRHHILGAGDGPQRHVAATRIGAGWAAPASTSGENDDAMVMTRPDGDVAPTEHHRGSAPRVVARPPGVPGARAIVGGLLVTAAAVGTFWSWRTATGAPDRSYAVAIRALQPGERLDVDAVGFEPVDLPPGVAGAAFTSPSQLEGRVLVAPVNEGELLQQGSVSDQVPGAPAVEVSITLARDLAVDGRLRPGDTVDVYATEDATTVAAEGLRVVAVTEAGGSFGDGSELTVTLALPHTAAGVPIVQAAREGQVTLVRTTHAAGGTASSDAVPPTGPAAGVPLAPPAAPATPPTSPTPPG